MLSLQVRVGSLRGKCTEHNIASVCVGQTFRACLCAPAQELLAERGGAKAGKATFSSKELELQSRLSNGV